MISEYNKKITNMSDLEKIKEEYNNKLNAYDFNIFVCSGGACVSSNCGEVKEALEKAIDKYKLRDKVNIITTGCIGSCNIGPVIVIMPDEVIYTRLIPSDMDEIVKSHLVFEQKYESSILLEKTYYDVNKKKYIPHINDIDFFKHQIKIALRNCGNIDFASIEGYIAKDGYMAIAKILNGMSSPEVINEIKKSGLRGRGGGGFPTGIKLEAGYKQQQDEKFVVCNADEGDPGAFMDRSLIEGDPHTVIEGMMISGYAIGAKKGFIYVRAEYPLAIDRLREALETARRVGLLGKNILGSNFDFELEIRIGAGAFVCGEETALMASIEGKRGEPKQKPPFPFQEGLFGKPTIINNVETLANLPIIILKSGEWYAQYGTEKSKGTKVFALAGDINNTGLVEVPMGISLGDIIFNIGGGISNDKKFKAVQIGGPSGGCLTAEHLNIPIDYDSLTSEGAIMGSGSLIAMDEDTCMVDVARFFMDFIQDESCGKCTPCRIGTKRMLEILERITIGKGTNRDIELLKELGETIIETAICGLGQTAPNPVLSTIRHFLKEYKEHIEDNYCEAGICSELFISPCQNACPARINVPGYIALISEGRIRDAYNLIRQENPFPTVCGRVCTHPCEYKCRRSTIDESISVMDLKRYVSDYILDKEEPYRDLVFPKNGKKVGIVGAGPSGLTCGYYLARLGYEVNVYEDQPVAGGMLAYGIPEYRLPKKILNKEIKTIEQVGVKIHLNTNIGKDKSFEELSKENDAVYIAIGTQFSKKVNIPGEELEGVYHGLDFLRDSNLNKEVTVGKTVVVIGGGSTAFDSARMAIRKGAEKVTIIYRRELKDMPADKREIEEAIEEGIEIRTLTAPLKFIGKNNKVESIECVSMELGEFDTSVRRKPRALEDSSFLIEAEMVIPAVSQYSDLPFIKNKDEVGFSKWGTFEVDKKTLMTKKEGIFAGGDVIRGADIVITAIADGKKAAISIDKYLGGKGILNVGEPIEIPVAKGESDVMEHERFPVKLLDPEKRKNNFDEVVLGFHKLNAIAESMRCLRCDRRA